MNNRKLMQDTLEFHVIKIHIKPYLLSLYDPHVLQYTDIGQYQYKINDTRSGITRTQRHLQKVRIRI